MKLIPWLLSGAFIQKNYIVVTQDTLTDYVQEYTIGDFHGYHVYASAWSLMHYEIYEDEEVAIEYVPMDFTTETTQQKSVGWNLARISNMEDKSTFLYPSRAGEGVNVYVLDTGILTNHSEFGGRARIGKNFVGEPDGDFHSHGTHVAGIIGGKIYGVAKKCNLIDVKVMGKTGSGSWTNVLAGLDWVYKDIKAPSVVHMSISGGKVKFVDDVLRNMASKATVIVAAGNSRVDACNTSPGSSEPFITVVGSSGRENKPSSFTNFGSCVTLFAPGENIVAAGNNGKFMVKSGTSMAAPHASGVAAIILSYVNTPVKTMLKQWAWKGVVEGKDLLRLLAKI
jgi:cerevisin